MSSLLEGFYLQEERFLLAHTPFRRTVLTAVLGWGCIVYHPLRF